MYKNVYLYAVTMVIMTLELCYNFKDVLRWNFFKISAMIDIVVENTHAKINGGCRDRFFAKEIIDLKMCCLTKTF